MKTIIVGPSHVVRWEHAVKSGSIDAPFTGVVFVGLGEAPIWSKELLDKVSNIYNEGDRIIIVMGDFRFGNNVFERPGANDELFVTGFRNISKDFINEGNDKFLINKSLEALNFWHARYGDSISVIHWTLVMRSAEDRSKNKYVDSQGTYKHPLYDGLRIIKESNFSCDISPSFYVPPYELHRYYIDDDLHPSPKGYQLMRHLALGNKWEDAVSFTELGFLRSLLLGLNFRKNSYRKVLICGDSVFLSYILRLFTNNDLNFLESIGIYIKQSSFENLANLTFKENIKDLIFITKNGFHNPSFSKKDIAAIPEMSKSFGYKGRIGVIPWESIGYYAISFRHPTLERYRKDISDISLWLSSSGFMLQKLNVQGLDEIYDVGEKVMPTLKGIKFIFNICLSILAE